MDATDSPAMDAATAAVYERYTKLELVTLCRSHGWTGDNARTSKEELAAFAAAHGVTVTATPAATGGNPADMLAAAMRAMMATLPATVDEHRVREICGEMIDAHAGLSDEHIRQLVAELAAEAAKQPQTIVIRPNGERVELAEHVHPVFAEVCDAIEAGVNVMLVGPTQCGKTHLAGQVARATGREFGSLSCTAGTSESEIDGWLLPVGDGGRFEYVPAPFVTLWENGNSLFLFDEMDASDPNFLLKINSATANGHMSIPKRFRQPLITRGVNAAVMAACNTYGTGSDAKFVGRNQLDASTLARFYRITMDYDKAYEETQGPAEVCEWVWAIREKIGRMQIRRDMSTRQIQQAAAMLAKGHTFEHIQGRLLSGWTRDELAKIGR